MRIKNKSALIKEDTSTSLVGIIGVFMVLIAFIGNNEGVRGSYIKANISEKAYASFRQYETNTLKIGEQTIRIGGKEYIVTVRDK